MKPEPIEDLRRQADIAVRVLTVFRGAALLLDEVSSHSTVAPIFSAAFCLRSPMPHLRADLKRYEGLTVPWPRCTTNDAVNHKAKMRLS